MDGTIIWWCIIFPILIILIICIIAGVRSHNKKKTEGRITEGSPYFDPDIYNQTLWNDKYLEEYGEFENNKDVKYLIKNLPQIDNILNYEFKHSLSLPWQQEFGEDLYYGARKTKNLKYIIEAIKWRNRLYDYLVKVVESIRKFPDLYLYNDEKNQDIWEQIVEYGEQIEKDIKELIKIGNRIDANLKKKSQNDEVANAYKILGIKAGSSLSEINSARLKLIMKYHPDHNKSPGAAEKFMQIQKAYEIVIKSKKNRSK